MHKLVLIIILFITQSIYAQKTATPWIGVSIGESDLGVLVKEALEDTPAKKAGLKSGYIIQKIDDKELKSPAHLIETVRAKGVGHKVVLSVLNEKGKKEKTKSKRKGNRE